MLDNRRHTNSVASSSVPDESPNLSRRGASSRCRPPRPSCSAFLSRYAATRAADRSRNLCAECLHQDRPARGGHADHAAGRDGPGHLHLHLDDPGGGAGRGLEPREGRACTGRREALRQPGPDHPGDGQLQLDPRVLETSTPGRRRHARVLRRGRRAQLGRLDRGVPDGEWQGDPRPDRVAHSTTAR